MYLTVLIVKLWKGMSKLNNKITKASEKYTIYASLICLWVVSHYWLVVCFILSQYGGLMISLWPMETSMKFSHISGIELGRTVFLKRFVQQSKNFHSIIMFFFFVGVNCLYLYDKCILKQVCQLFVKQLKGFLCKLSPCNVDVKTFSLTRNKLTF